MTVRPRDLTDLYLSPVALQLDRRLEEFSRLSSDELSSTVALSTDREPRDAASRSALALKALTHLLPLHGWGVTWDARGLRVSHDEHELVLGVPDNLRRYIAP